MEIIYEKDFMFFFGGEGGLWHRPDLPFELTSERHTKFKDHINGGEVPTHSNRDRVDKCCHLIGSTQKIIYVCYIVLSK